MTESGKLTPAQVQSWIELDQEYLERLGGICPEALR